MELSNWEKFYENVKRRIGGEQVLFDDGSSALGTYNDGTILPFSCFFFPRVTTQQVNRAERNWSLRFPRMYKSFLASSNGAFVAKKSVTVFGLLGSVSNLGQPISISYGNIYERPDGAPNDFFVVGGFPHSQSEMHYFGVNGYSDEIITCDTRVYEPEATGKSLFDFLFQMIDDAEELDRQ